MAEHTITLNDNEWEQFAAALNHPPEPTQALRDLLARHAPWGDPVNQARLSAYRECREIAATEASKWQDEMNTHRRTNYGQQCRVRSSACSDVVTRIDKLIEGVK